jgi:hypothetical protein
MTACGLVMAARQGMPMREKELTYLRDRLHEAVNSDDLEPEVVARRSSLWYKRFGHLLSRIV